MRKLSKDTKAKMSMMYAVIIAALLISVTVVGTLFATGKLQIGTEDGTTLTFIDDDKDGIADQIDDDGMVAVNRPVTLIVKNFFTKAASTSNGVIVYDDDGVTALASGTTDGTTGELALDAYPSGKELIIELANTNADYRQSITVPRIFAADVDALTTNEITIYTFTVPNGDVAMSITPVSTGTALADGGDWNKTVSGNTDTFTILWTLPTDNEGYMSSVDELATLNNGQPMDWNAVMFCKLYGTNYELASLSGWDGQYTKGTAVWYYKMLDDYEVSKYKVGSTYFTDSQGRRWDGSYTFSHDIDATGYSGDAADLEYYMYVNTDPAWHDQKGSFGDDSYSILTSSPFTVDLVD